MNDLTDQFGDSFAALGFPSNQFGHQTNENNGEILNTLKHVRPGGGYEPNFQMFEKLDINGDTEDPVFTFLKKEQPYPSDDRAGTGADYVLEKNFFMIWAPLRRSDVGWNFEKFLVNQEGRPVKRYSPKFETKDVAADIEKLIKDGPNALDN